MPKRNQTKRSEAQRRLSKDIEAIAATRPKEPLMQVLKPNEIFKPSATLLIKLGSLIVHYQEFVTEQVLSVYTDAKAKPSYEFDLAAIKTLENDPEVVEWLQQMDKQAFLPKKRK
jgi:hypothetical protein